MLEIAISRKWASVSAVLMSMSKAIEKRMWPFQNPLYQSNLSANVLYQLEQWADELSVTEIASQTAADLGKLIHMNELHGRAVLDAAKHFPAARIQYALRPLSSDLLKIEVVLHRAFNWNAKVHGSSEPFWLWIEDGTRTYILQWAHLIFTPASNHHDIDFVIPTRGAHPLPPVRLRFVSDRWLGAEEEIDVDLSDVIVPAPARDRTPLLELPQLPLSVLRNPTLEQAYSGGLQYLNSIQTQCFWAFYNTQRSILLSAPSASGKSLLGQLAVWYVLYGYCPAITKPFSIGVPFVHGQGPTF